jgi:hypothetical protein
MARAGAASIVLERTIQWEPYDETANMDKSVMDCASHWLVEHVKFNGHFITMGNYGNYWTGLRSLCIGMPCGDTVGIGWARPTEQLNILHLLSENNYSQPAQWMARHLKLTVDPKWFSLELHPYSTDVAATEATGRTPR